MEGTACLDDLALENSAAGWSALATRCGTDQGPNMPHFWEHLQGMQYSPFTMLEIGVYRGGSLATWKEIFPNAKIYSLDINPDCAQYADPPRVNVHIGSGGPVTLDEWLSQVTDPIDVIIDDGSHVMEHLKASFFHLFPKLRAAEFMSWKTSERATCPSTAVDCRNRAEHDHRRAQVSGQSAPTQYDDGRDPIVCRRHSCPLVGHGQSTPNRPHALIPQYLLRL